MPPHHQSLAALPPGSAARIAAIHADELLAQRLRALGLRIGRPVCLIRRAAFNGPLHVRLDGTDLVLRQDDARRIEITRP